MLLLYIYLLLKNKNPQSKKLSLNCNIFYSSFFTSALEAEQLHLKLNDQQKQTVFIYFRNFFLNFVIFSSDIDAVEMFAMFL
jgi:hypothetical protein